VVVLSTDPELHRATDEAACMLGMMVLIAWDVDEALDQLLGAPKLVVVDLGGEHMYAKRDVCISYATLPMQNLVCGLVCMADHPPIHTCMHL
jgi:hypothetical protein